MKKILTITAAAFTLCVQAQTLDGKLSAPAQSKEGKVIYERTMRMGNIRMSGAEALHCRRRYKRK